MAAEAMTRQTLTTTEAAHFAGVDPRCFARWARARGIQPERRMRIGRSFITVWSIARMIAATRQQVQLDADRIAC